MPRYPKLEVAKENAEGELRKPSGTMWYASARSSEKQTMSSGKEQTNWRVILLVELVGEGFCTVKPKSLNHN